LGNLGCCLITGGFGFLGRAIIGHLAGQCERLVVCAPFEDALLSEEFALKTYETSLENQDELRLIMREEHPDFILHLAANVSAERDFGAIRQSVLSNVLPLLNLLCACESLSSLKLLVNFGSAEEYGMAPLLFREEVKERPQSAYALAKVWNSSLVSMFADQFDVPAVSLRPTLIYGPGQRPDKFIPYVISHALRDEPIEMTKGEQIRDFIYVEDFAKVIERVLKFQFVKFGCCINVASGHTKKIIDVARQIVTLIGSASKVLPCLPYRANEMMDMRCEDSKLQSILGGDFVWTSIDDGLRMTIDFYAGKNEKCKS
jgi:nucleoside-diphosphate-sugar epimerase